MQTLQEPDPGYQTVPVDRSVDFDPMLYPADPEAYEPLTHFLQRQREDQRYLTKPLDDASAVRESIRQGKLRDNRDGCAVFVYPYHGVTYYIIVGFHEKGYRVAVTGWPHLNSRQEALDSGVWTTDDCDTIEEFNDT